MMIGWYYLKVKFLNKVRRKTDMKDNKISITVRGMTCMHCAGTVKKAVESVAGTSDVVVDLDGKKVEFETEERDNIEKIKEAIERAGYSV